MANRLAPLTLVLLLACSDNAGPTRAPAAMEAAAPVEQSGTVGRPVASSPTVRVTDAEGEGLAGVTVLFTVSAGGGSVSVASAETNREGLATAGEWVLGTAVMENRVTARVTGLAPMIFTAAAVADVPVQMDRVQGDDQFVLAGRPVPILPAVRLIDRYENPVVNATVNFSATAGVLAGSSVVTDGDGVATVPGWTLGAPGQGHQLTATMGTLSAQFTATPVDPCTHFVTLGMNGTSSGTLDALDCQAGGSARDRISFTLTGQEAIRLRIGATALAYRVQLHGPTGNVSEPLILADPAIGEQFRFVLPAGTYTADVTPVERGATGGYSVGRSPADPEQTCASGPLRIAQGVILQQSLGGADCDAAGGGKADELLAYLTAGRSYEFVVTADPAVELTLLLGTTEVATGTPGTEARISFTPAQSALYRLRVQGSTVGYTVSMQ